MSYKDSNRKHSATEQGWSSYWGTSLYTVRNIVYFIKKNNTHFSLNFVSYYSFDVITLYCILKWDRCLIQNYYLLEIVLHNELSLTTNWSCCFVNFLICFGIVSALVSRNWTHELQAELCKMIAGIKNGELKLKSYKMNWIYSDSYMGRPNVHVLYWDIINCLELHKLSWLCLHLINWEWPIDV